MMSVINVLLMMIQRICLFVCLFVFCKLFCLNVKKYKFVKNTVVFQTFFS